MKKYILMFLFVVIVIAVTLVSVFDSNTIPVLIDSMKEINVLYIVILFGILVLYFLLQATYMKIILKSLNQRITLVRGIFYSMVEFYFSGVTPSSTMGQPMQLYFMTKHKIPMSDSYITLILNTIYFKVTILILGIFILIFNNSYIFGHSTLYTVFFFLGLGFDILLVCLGLLLLLNQTLIKKLLNMVLKICKKIPLVKKRVAHFNVTEILNRYKNQLGYMKKHNKEVICTFMITFIQRLLLFSIVYFVYRGLGFSNLSYIELLVIQVSVQITMEAFPIPGGSGLSENMLRDIFLPLVGVGFAEAGMIFTRLFTYYIPLLITGIIIVIYYIYNNIKGSIKYEKK